jgi:predicted ArsR family transcriptional regulator
VWSLIRTLDNATQEGSSIPIEQVQDQADALVLQIVETLEGDAESELVAAMLRLRRTLEGQRSGEARSAEVAAAQALVVNLVNTFYRERLMLMPTIAEYIERIQAEADTGDEH